MQPKNSTRYNRTRNFGRYGHAESKKSQKFVFRSALRTNLTRPRPKGDINRARSEGQARQRENLIATATFRRISVSQVLRKVVDCQSSAHRRMSASRSFGDLNCRRLYIPRQKLVISSAIIGFVSFSDRSSISTTSLACSLVIIVISSQRVRSVSSQSALRLAAPPTAGPIAICRQPFLSPYAHSLSRQILFQSISRYWWPLSPRCAHLSATAASRKSHTLINSSVTNHRPAC